MLDIFTDGHRLFHPNKDRAETFWSARNISLLVLSFMESARQDFLCLPSFVILLDTREVASSGSLPKLCIFAIPHDDECIIPFYHYAVASIH